MKYEYVCPGCHRTGPYDDLDSQKFSRLIWDYRCPYCRRPVRIIRVEDDGKRTEIFS